MPTKQENQRRYQKNHYNKNKKYYKDKRDQRRKSLEAMFFKYKSTLKCQLCPEDTSIALDFHHADPTKKEALVHRLTNYGRSWLNVIKEIEKCHCLCANCHRKIHHLPEWLQKLQTIPLLVVPLEFRIML